MESLPSLQSLHQALTCEDAIEAEEELLSIISHLLVCAIEDPGVPNPIRHTTLLGQSLRTADITNSNISEILRIYLYAVATGEVRTLNGVTLDRERERRIADHHQHDSELMLTTGKNQAYYEALQQNQTWKLSECLKDKPFVSLNPTVKAEILAHLCNDLLLNKAVVRQIENSLDSVAQHKRDRYAIENRVRKYKHLHARKMRMEQFEKQQAIARQIQAQQLAQAQAAQAAAAAAALQASSQENATNASSVDGDSENKTTNIPSTTDNNNESSMDKSISESNLIKTPSNLTNASSVDNFADVSEFNNHKDDSIQSTDVVINAKNIDDDKAKNVSMGDDASRQTIEKCDTSAIDTSRVLNNGATTPDITNLLNKKINNRDVTADGSTTDGNLEEELSDIESEGTILEEDEDTRMTADEVHKKLEKIMKSAYQNKMLIEQSSNSLRATCYGQDRYWRRYWHLPKTGGIYVEGLEAAQPEILKYHLKLEEIHNQNEVMRSKQNANSECENKKRGKKRKLSLTDEPVSAFEKTSEQPLSENDSSSENTTEIISTENDDQTTNQTNDESKQPDDLDSEATKDDTIEENQTESLEVDQSDKKAVIETAVIIDIEPSTKAVDSAAETTENESKHKNCVKKANATNAENANSSDTDMLDIEDSIPRAILVQKANENDETVVEVNNQLGRGDMQNAQQQQLHNNHTDANNTENTSDDNEITHKLNCDSKPNLENGSSGVDVEVVEKKPIVPIIDLDTTESLSGDGNPIVLKDDSSAPIKIEPIDGSNVEIKMEIKEELTEDDIKREPILDKWFSIANREIQLSSMETTIPLSAQAEYSNITCEMILSCQGNRWDIGNNAYYFHVPVEGPSNLQINRDSVLTLSGIDDKLMEKVLSGTIELEKMEIEPNDNESIDEGEDDEKKCADIKMEPETQPFQLPSFLNMSFANINAFVQCDNPCPLQMTPDEQKMLDEVKLIGFPKRLESNCVPKELCHGWWKINDVDSLNEVIQCLHVKGVRERELRINLLQALTENIDLSTPCHVANLRSPPPLKGYIDPEPMNAWNPQVARRVELALLDQVESLEDKIASASMQVKGWTAPTRDPETESELDLVTGITMIRDRILGLESAIERRYLKPPLGTSTADANIAAITTQSVTTLSSTREITTTIQTTGTTTTVISSSSSAAQNNDDQNSSSGSVATTPEREVLPKGKGN